MLEGHNVRWYEVLKAAAPVLLDDAAACSTSLLAASDDLISTLYHPQDITAVKAQSTLFESRISDMQHNLKKFGLVSESDKIKQIDDINVELPKMLSALSVSTTQNLGKEVQDKERKWFEACFKQIGLAYDAIALSDSDLDEEIGTLLTQAKTAS